MGNELDNQIYTTESHDVKLSGSAGKAVPVVLTFPSVEGKFPLIIFSHGAGGDRQAYSYLAKYWAARGYVVAQPSHADSIGWNRELRKPFSFIRVLKTIGDDKTGWINRAKDVSFVIDSLQDFEPSRWWTLPQIDFDRIGVAGHSYGAYTSLLIAGARPPQDNGVPLDDVKDSRVKAIIAISPQGLRGDKVHSLGFDNPEDFGELTLPILFVSGDRDVSAWNDADQRLDAFKFAPPGDKYAVTILGANHMTFVGAKEDQRYGKVGRPLWEGMPAAYGDERQQLRLVERVTFSFWDSYLGGASINQAKLLEQMKRQVGESGIFEER